MNIIIKPSDKTNKKFMAVLENKKIHFGDRRYSDYTKHKDPERKKTYLSRHKNDNFKNLLYPSFYATNLLWNKPTLKESIRDTNNKYNKYKVKIEV